MREHKYYLGKPEGQGRAYITWTLDEKKEGAVFSMSAEVWQISGRDIDMGGQCVDKVAAMFPHDEKAQRMAEVWARWHLNDMRPGCEHQREWNTDKPIEITRYTWGPAFHALRRQVEDGAAEADEYQEYRAIKTKVYAVTMGLKAPKWETPEIKELLALEMVKVEKTETKTAGWIHPEEHPEGLLCRPCPDCGYKYGSSWVFEEIPAEILAEIRTWG